MAHLPSPKQILPKILPNSFGEFEGLMGPKLPCSSELVWCAHKKQPQCYNNQLKTSVKKILEGSQKAWQLYKTKAIMWSSGGAAEKELWGRTTALSYCNRLWNSAQT